MNSITSLKRAHLLYSLAGKTNMCVEKQKKTLYYCIGIAATKVTISVRDLCKGLSGFVLFKFEQRHILFEAGIMPCVAYVQSTHICKMSKHIVLEVLSFLPRSWIFWTSCQDLDN